LPTRRWPRRRACPLRPSKRSTAARPRAFTQKDEALVHPICSELFKTQRVSDANFTDAVASLGETGLIEVIGIIGYYTLIGNTLNVFQVALPEDEKPPFPE
jgi:4-carboxymuconolactone decarboxylase